MPIIFNDSRLELAENCKLVQHLAHRGSPLEDPRSAVAQALSSPLDFPALADCIVPGDQIAIAIDRDVPQIAEVVAGVVDALLEGTTQPADLTIVLTHDNDLEANDVLQNVAAEIRAEIRFERHDPTDKDQLCYLAANEDAQPIYVNRYLYDADVVVPVAALRLSGTAGYVGMHGGIYPGFSDVETQQRFHASCVDLTASHDVICQQAQEAAWLLGVQLSLQVIPGPGDSLLHIVTGESGVVAQVGPQLCDAAWRHEATHSAALVIATIDGAAAQQTWDSFARALSAASALVDDGGTVVLCTSLDRQPGLSLQRMVADEPIETSDTLGTDTLAAAVLSETRGRHRVFLLSELSAETVEDLGLGHASCLDDVSRLSHSFDTCIVLENAHRTSFLEQHSTP